MKRLCTICARGGSKGVPNKNIRVVAGRPLIAHTVAQALETGLFDVQHVEPAADVVERIRAWPRLDQDDVELR